MKTLDECKTEIAEKYGFFVWSDLHQEHWPNIEDFEQEALDLYAKAYALSCIEASLIKAAERLLFLKLGITIEQWQEVYKSIKGPSNHVLL